MLTTIPRSQKILITLCCCCSILFSIQRCCSSDNDIIDFDEFQLNDNNNNIDDDVQNDRDDDDDDNDIKSRRSNLASTVPLTIPTPTRRYCVDAAIDRHYYECSIDPLEIRMRLLDIPYDSNNFYGSSSSSVSTNIDSNSNTRQEPDITTKERLDYGFNLGVPQTIDGTDDEQTAIREIIRLMNNYWYAEVLSNTAYESIRTIW
jgi:hypothetical protein